MCYIVNLLFLSRAPFAGPPQSVRQLVRVGPGQAPTAQRHVRGRAREAARLLHMPLQGQQSRQVSFIESPY